MYYLAIHFIVSFTFVASYMDQLLLCTVEWLLYYSILKVKMI